MGVGIIASMAFSVERDKNLQSIPVGEFFGTNTSRIALKQGAYLRGYVYTFIELLVPTLNRKLIDRMLLGFDEDYQVPVLG
jgi:LysR family cys regulon transcriptional activator